SLGTGATKQALYLAADFEYQQLAARIDIRYQNSFTRQDRDEPLARQPLQSFADRRSSNVKSCRQHLLRQHIAGLEPQRDNLLFDKPIGLLGQRFASPHWAFA